MAVRTRAPAPRTLRRRGRHLDRRVAARRSSEPAACPPPDGVTISSAACLKGHVGDPALAAADFLSGMTPPRRRDVAVLCSVAAARSRPTHRPPQMLMPMLRLLLHRRRPTPPASLQARVTLHSPSRSARATLFTRGRALQPPLRPECGSAPASPSNTYFRRRSTLGRSTSIHLASSLCARGAAGIELTLRHASRIVWVQRQPGGAEWLPRHRERVPRSADPSTHRLPIGPAAVRGQDWSTMAVTRVTAVISVSQSSTPPGKPLPSLEGKAFAAAVFNAATTPTRRTKVRADACCANAAL